MRSDFGLLRAHVTPLEITIPTVWEELRSVRAQVAEHLKTADDDLRDAAVMAASELAENALKYGHPVPGAEESRLRLELRGDALTVTCSSGVSDPSVAHSTLERIAVIRASPDKYGLYVARMREMLGQVRPSGTSTQLGLYRICGEGDFELHGELDGNVFRISATRPLTFRMENA